MFELQTATGNATCRTVTKPSTLITNKKLTLQLFRVTWPRPSQHSVGMFQGHPNSRLACSPGLFIALFTEADTPQSWLVEGLWLSLGKNVPERRCGGRKDVGLAVRQTWACVQLARRGCVTWSKTLILSGS